MLFHMWAFQVRLQTCTNDYKKIQLVDDKKISTPLKIQVEKCDEFFFTIFHFENSKIQKVDNQNYNFMISHFKK